MGGQGREVDFQRRLADQVRHLALGLALLLAVPGIAGAVQPVFDPAGTSFYDLPFPQELRRDLKAAGKS